MSSPQLKNGYTKIANDIIEALCHIRISGEARQILDVIFRQTYGYNQKDTIISFEKFAIMTGLKKPTITRAIHKLFNMNLITKKDNGKYCFQKDFDNWKPLPKKITNTKKITTDTKKDNYPIPKKITKNTKKITFTDRLKDTLKDIGPKDILKDIEIIKEKYLDFVFLTKEEHQKLVDRFGEDGCNERIERLNEYGHQKPKKFKEYGSHYHTILVWARREEKKPNSKYFAELEKFKGLED